jgi:hypothetical protein
MKKKGSVISVAALVMAISVATGLWFGAGGGKCTARIFNKLTSMAKSAGPEMQHMLYQKTVDDFKSGKTDSFVLTGQLDTQHF